jgi:hypothetical protein
MTISGECFCGKMHIFVGSEAAWEVMPEGVIEFEQAPPG